MKILFAASECVPFIKTGGLADVVGALAPVLAAQGHDVRVILPLYSAISPEWTSKMTHEADFETQLGWRRQYCGIEKLEMNGVTWYFVDNKYYFSRSYLYGLGGDEYERFAFFDRAVLNALPLINFQPDVLHCHDWQTGMVPALLKLQYSHLDFYESIKTVFTIHNLQYQGVFGINDVADVLGLSYEYFTADQLECYGCANFMKAAIVYADKITTVSPSYSQEIQTSYYGERLDGLLRARSHDLSGLLNGIDINAYNPETDPLIAASYSAGNTSGKSECKKYLQEKLGLKVEADTPIIAMIGRLTGQKGLDLVDYVIGSVLNENVQLVVLGQGDGRYMDLFSWAEQQYPGRVAARFAMDSNLAREIYAGADMFLMPSLFEPCGLSQLIAMRYGTVPIVRETGGLRDTVLSYNEFTGEGNGFSFFNYNAHDMLNVIRRALYFYNQEKSVWATLMNRDMTADFSWTHSSKAYIALYNELTGLASPSEKPKRRTVKKVKDAPAEKKPTSKKAPAKKAEAAPIVTKPTPKKAAVKKAAKAPAEKKPTPNKAPAKKAETAPILTKPAVKKTEKAPTEKKPVSKKTPAKKRIPSK